MDKLVLGHCPSLESHLIGDDDIPMNSRDLLVRTGCVLFPSIWSKREAESVTPLPLGGKDTKALRTEIQLAHDGGLLNRAVFRLNLIERMAGGFVYDCSGQRRALGE